MRMRIERELKMLSEAEIASNPKLEELYQMAMNNLSDDDIVEEVVEKILKIKNKKLDHLKRMDNQKARTMLLSFALSQKLYELIEADSQKSGKKNYEVLWEILSKHYDIPSEECNPSYWIKKQSDELKARKK